MREHLPQDVPRSEPVTHHLADRPRLGHCLFYTSQRRILRVRHGLDDKTTGSRDDFVRLDKEFTGKAGTQKSKQEGARIKLVYMEVDATDSDCRGNEPIYANGKVVGLTTSGGYGFSVGKSLAFGYVEPELATEGQDFEIAIYDEMKSARIIAQPIYDPENARPRA